MITPTNTYREAVTSLHYLETCPIVLVLDGLDQLSDLNLARSRLSFLAGMTPHEDTRILVSCLSDAREGSTALATATTSSITVTTSFQNYCYQCETRLIEDLVPMILLLLLDVDGSSYLF